MSKFDVVISGVSGRFPLCNDVATFRQKLYEQENFITFGEEKWPAQFKYKFDEGTVPQGTGKYTNSEKYDAMVFRLNHLFASSNDITNRVSLEPSFEAIMDAGINPYSLDGRNIGVYMSCGINEMDCKILSYEVTTMTNLPLMLGFGKTMLSNLISFAFNFNGPSYTYYTDVLGGMQALRAGYKNIADGFVEAAIVGMASNVIDPALSIQFSSLGLVSPDAMCRAFDESANGFGRSESAVLFFLQRAEDAKRNYGTIRLCDSYYLGLNPSTLVGFDENYIMDSLRAIYDNNESKIDPTEISFLEMNACGVQRLDEIESNAVAEIFCKNRKNPLLVGSVKSNVGHTEGAAAIVSVLKALFALETDFIAPNLHFKKANNKIRALRDGKLKVVDKLTKLPGNTVAVNSLGLAGSMGHIVIEQNSKGKSKNTDECNLPRLLLICGRTKDGLQAAIDRIEAQPFDANFVSLANQVFGSNMPLHAYRGFTILPKPSKSWSFTEDRGELNRPVWFLFSGMGSQWNGMGRGLLDIPVFAHVVRRSNAVLQPRGLDIYKILTSDDTTIFDNIVNCFAGIITVQIGLVEILKVLKIEADGIIGHSVGENACAYADGCLTMEQAILASWARGVASIEIDTIQGMMAAVGKGYDEIKDSLPEDIQVACHNSSSNCTLSGPTKSVNELVTKLQKDGIFAKSVNVANIAYHSKYIAPAEPGLLRRLQEIITEPKARSLKWISSSAPESTWDTPLAKSCSAEYLTNNLLNPVLFEEGCKHIPDNAIVIEIAPQGLMQAIMRKSMPGCSNIALPQNSSSFENVNTLLSVIGKLYVAGCEPDVNALYPEITYPVPRNTPPISPFGTWDHSAIDVKMIDIKQPMFRLWDELILIQVNEDSKFHYLRHHMIGEQIYVPPAYFIYMTWWLYALKNNTPIETSSVLFKNVRVHKNITVSILNPKAISVTIQRSGCFEISLMNAEKYEDIIMSGKIKLSTQEIEIDLDEGANASANTAVDGADFYHLLKEAGYNLDGHFAALKYLWKNGTNYFGRLTWNSNWVAFLDSLMKFEMFSEMKPVLLCPTFIRRLYICGSKFECIQNGSPVLCYKDPHAKRVVCNGLEMDGLDCELMLVSAQDSSVIKLEGLRFTSFSDSECESEYQFIKLCLLLGFEYLPMVKNCAKKLSVVNEVKNLEKPIDNMIFEDSIMKSTLYLHNSKEEFHWRSSGQKSCLLLITGDIEGAFTFEWNPLFVLAVVSKDSAFKISTAFVEILKKTFDDNSYYFLKKKSVDNGCNNMPNVVQYEDWISKPKMSGPMVVIKNHIDVADLSSMLSRRDRFDDTRFLYWMDDSKLTKQNELLNNRILHLVPTAVMRNGEWGTYRKLCDSDTISLEEPEKPKNAPLTNIKLTSVEVHYLSASEENDGSSVNDHTSCLGYAGIDSSGNRVMGFARIKAFEETPPNHNLLWSIPDSWSLEDAATLLLPYAQAYHILFVLWNYGLPKSMLINVGTEYLLAEACVTLAVQHSISVYLNILNLAEESIMKSKFPMLEEFRFLHSETVERDLLMATENKPVDLIVNCAAGGKYITEYMNCLDIFGCFVEIGSQNCNHENELGLYPFMKCLSFVVVPHIITALLNASEEDQKTLRDRMDDGIKTGLVKPFTKAHSSPNSAKCMNSINSAHPNPEANQKLQIDANHSYIIVGGEHNYAWLELIEWLTDKGARMFVVAIDRLKLSQAAAHSVSRLITQRQVNMSFSPSCLIETSDGAAQFVRSAENMAPVEAIFFVALENASKKIGNVDAIALQRCPYVKFVCIFSGGLKECESRRALGLPAVVIHGENRKLTPILPHLGVYLSQWNNSNSSPLLTVVGQTDADEELLKVLSVTDYVPKDLRFLEEIGSSFAICDRFVEVSSASLRYSETRGVYPVFVIPAINAAQLKKLIRKLAYPAFCATWAESVASVLDVAADLFRDLNEIQPRGPVTIIGETWSSNIAFEMMSLVRGSGRKCRLILIEGNPVAWRNHLKTFGPPGSQQFDSNVAELFYDTKAKENVNMPIDSYQKQMKTLISMSDNVNEGNVLRAVDFIRNRLQMMAQYKLKDELLSDVFLLQRHKSDLSSLRLSVTSKVILLEDKGYENLLADAKLGSVINENALFSWWDYGKV